MLAQALLSGSVCKNVILKEYIKTKTNPSYLWAMDDNYTGSVVEEIAGNNGIPIGDPSQQQPPLTAYSLPTDKSILLGGSTQNPATVDDDFTGVYGDLPNQELWNISDHEAGCIVEINNNRLLLKNCENSEDPAIKSKYNLETGNFDIQVDYDASANDTEIEHGYSSLELTMDGGYTLYLSYRSPSTIRSFFLYSNVPGYSFDYKSAELIYPVGKLRLVLNNNILEGFYHDGVDWVLLTPGFTFGDIKVEEIQLKIGEYGARPVVTTYFDNFIVNSGTIVWPGSGQAIDTNLTVSSQASRTVLMTFEMTDFPEPQLLFSDGDYEGLTKRLHLGINTDYWAWIVSDGVEGYGNSDVHPHNLVVGEKYIVAYVIDVHDISIYVNGELSANFGIPTDTAPAAGVGDLMIGKDGSADLFYGNFYVDLFVVYDEALSLTDIRASAGIFLTGNVCGAPTVDDGFYYYLTIQNPSSASNLFGESVGISDLYCSIGTFANHNTFYLFNNSDGTLKYTHDDPEIIAGSQYGAVVANSDDYHVTSDYGYDGGGDDIGRVYNYNNVDGNYIAIDSPFVTLNNLFGRSVDCSNSYLITGGSSDGVGGRPQRGFATIYETNGTLVSVLDNSNDPLVDYDNFGWDVGCSEVYSVVSAVGKQSNTGRAYIYNNSNGSFNKVLNNPNNTAGDYFGSSIACSNTHVAVGARGSGKVYIFDIETGGLLHILSNPGNGVQYGNTVGCSNLYTIVGCSDDSTDGIGTGKAYLYSNATGDLITSLYDPDQAVNQEFGSSVECSDSYAIVGAKGNDVDGANFGRCYLYREL